MASNELFSVTALELNVDGTAPTGDLASFNTKDFTQVVIQATATNGVMLTLQVSPDGANWFDAPGGSFSVGGASASTAVDDVAFPTARFRYSAEAFSIFVSVRVLGRL